jgi:hypothetical protein
MTGGSSPIRARFSAQRLGPTFRESSGTRKLNPNLIGYCTVSVWSRCSVISGRQFNLTATTDEPAPTEVYPDIPWYSHGPAPRRRGRVESRVIGIEPGKQICPHVCVLRAGDQTRRAPLGDLLVSQKYPAWKVATQAYQSPERNLRVGSLNLDSSSFVTTPRLLMMWICIVAVERLKSLKPLPSSLSF